MSDEMAEQQILAMRVDFREVPTVFTDYAMSFATAGSVARILMGELVFDHAEGAQSPRARSVVNLAIPMGAIPNLIALLNQILETSGSEAQNVG